MACPSTFGPITCNVTLTTPITTTAIARARSGRIIRSSRRLDPRKSIDFSVGIPPPNIRPGPPPAPPGPGPRFGGPDGFPFDAATPPPGSADALPRRAITPPPAR
ncbi:hypothetical protein GCM10022220_40120 [Actinocatenispora rupis]